MNLRRSRAAKAAVSVVALALLMGPSVAVAQETPAPTPTPTPTETLTPEQEEQAHDDGKHRPKDPKTNVFHLGQSMQIRVNADGEQNAKLLNFRWTVSHLTVQGPADGSQDGPVTVPVPEGGALPRYLENFGFIHVENGFGQWEMDVQGGFDTQRSVSLFPQDAEPKIGLTTEFTLNGEPVTAQEIVGKDGLVTATYTLHNRTTKNFDVVVKDLAGNDVTVTAEGDSPMVAITKTLLPQRYHGLNTGSGLYGADGRGNNQVQWISLPFKPLSEDSTASFGWAAHVTDAVIPSLLVQVSPLYIPAHDPEDPESEEAASGDTPIPLDPAVAEIQAGLANVIDGIALLTADDGSPDPLTTLEGQLNTFFQSLGTDLNTVVANLQPTIDALTQLEPILAELATTVGTINTELPAILDQLQQLSEQLNPTSCGELGPPAAIVDLCLELDEAIANVLVPGLSTIEGLVAVLAPLLDTISPLVTSLRTALQGVQSSLTTIAAGLAPVDLPTVDTVVASVVASIMATPGAQQVAAGMDQLSAGVAQAKLIVSDYVAGVVAELQAAGADANEIIIHLRGEIGALKAAAAESPLIYGPLPPGTPPDTILFAAYEFRVDAADTNHPYTLPRIVIGLLALIGAGLLGKFLGNRHEETQVTYTT